MGDETGAAVAAGIRITSSALFSRLTGQPVAAGMSTPLVTDRFGEVCMQESYAPDSPLPDVDQVAVDYIERRCPECGVAAGGWEEAAH